MNGADVTYTLKGVFVNKNKPEKQLKEFGPSPVGILEDRLVNLPNHMLEEVEEILKDEEDIPDVLTKLRVVYKNIMKLDYDNAASRALGAEGDGPDTEGKSFHELIGDFFQLYHGSQPSEKEWEIIEETAREAGVME